MINKSLFVLAVGLFVAHGVGIAADVRSFGFPFFCDDANQIESWLFRQIHSVLKIEFPELRDDSFAGTSDREKQCANILYTKIIKHFFSEDIATSLLRGFDGFREDDLKPPLRVSELATVYYYEHVLKSEWMAEFFEDDEMTQEFVFSLLKCLLNHRESITGESLVTPEAIIEDLKDRWGITLSNEALQRRRRGHESCSGWCVAWIKRHVLDNLPQA